MPDGFSIFSFLGSIKTAKETLTLIINAPRTLEKTEFEYKIASLMKTLSELETQALEFEKIIQERDKQIKELEDLLKFKGKLIRKDGLYFEADDNGNLIEEPYCPHCWEVKLTPTHLIKLEDNYFRCANCKTPYGKRKQPYSQQGYS